MMKLNQILILSVVLAILSGCNTGQKRDSGATISDTVVNTLPVNYMKTVEKMKASNLREIRSYKDIMALFDTLNYTPESWKNGIREVPRVYLTILGERWGSTTSKEIALDLKKRIFFRTMAPMVLLANELIMKDRKRLEDIRSTIMSKDRITEFDSVYIRKLAAMYRVDLEENKVSSSVLDELWLKVDIIPVSLALAQSAEESGWGTSRFAGKGNALYGQWTWGGNAIKPEQQREELGNYGIAAFGSIQESICAYMLNLNTHPAYDALRAKRAKLRNKKEKITGLALAQELTKYSERGEEYVKSLQHLMDYNQLIPADDAYLSDGPSIYLVAAKE